MALFHLRSNKPILYGTIISSFVFSVFSGCIFETGKKEVNVRTVKGLDSAYRALASIEPEPDQLFFHTDGNRLLAFCAKGANITVKAYDRARNIWKEESSVAKEFDTPEEFLESFEMDGRVYLYSTFYSGHIWIYTLSSKSWVDVPLSGKATGGSFTTILGAGSQVFLRGFERDFPQPIWRYDPEGATWSKLTENFSNDYKLFSANGKLYRRGIVIDKQALNSLDQFDFGSEKWISKRNFSPQDGDSIWFQPPWMVSEMGIGNRILLLGSNSISGSPYYYDPETETGHWNFHGSTDPWNGANDLGISEFEYVDEMTIFLLHDSGAEPMPFVYDLENGGGWQKMPPLNLGHAFTASHTQSNDLFTAKALDGVVFIYSRHDSSNATNFFDCKLPAH